METTLLIILQILLLVTFWFIGLCYGQKRMRKMQSAKLMTMRINCLYTRRNELQKILSASENGRMIDKVSKRLQAVTNKILEIEG